MTYRVHGEGSTSGPLDRYATLLRRWVEAEWVEAVAIEARDPIGVAVARRVQRDALRDLIEMRRN